MRIDIRWMNDEKTLLLWEFKEGWTFEDFRTTTENSFAMSNKEETIFDVIINFNHYPPPSPPIGEYRKAMSYSNPRMNRMVIVNNTFFGRMIVKMFHKAGISHHLRVMHADSVEDALRLLVNTPCEATGTS